MFSRDKPLSNENRGCPTYECAQPGRHVGLSTRSEYGPNGDLCRTPAVKDGEKQNHERPEETDYPQNKAEIKIHFESSLQESSKAVA